MTIGKVYKRELIIGDRNYPNGIIREKLADRVITEDTLAYHQDLKNTGVVDYQEVDVFDFDLPAVPTIRIHRREFVECESCSA